MTVRSNQHNASIIGKNKNKKNKQTNTKKHTLLSTECQKHVLFFNPKFIFISTHISVLAFRKLQFENFHLIFTFESKNPVNFNQNFLIFYLIFTNLVSKYAGDVSASSHVLEFVLY